MSNLLNDIDARTKLAGTNKLEILLFYLGMDPRTKRKEVYGINVFKVREVMRTPEITAAPDMPECVEGMVSLRGALVPVVDLAKYVGIQSEDSHNIMIVTEYNGHTQGFLVEKVDTILRLDWSQMRLPPEMLTVKMGGLVTAVTELPNHELVMMLDVEKVLSDTARYDEEYLFSNIEPVEQEKRIVFFADDSSVARKQIERTLKAMGIPYRGSVNGRIAWEELQKIAAMADTSGKKVKDIVGVVLTDVEMPELDGYMLTRQIKSDPRFMGVRVLMHSSLSSMSNRKLGESVGVDAYVPKFEPQRLAQTLKEMLGVARNGGMLHLEHKEEDDDDEA